MWSPNLGMEFYSTDKETAIAVDFGATGERLSTHQAPCNAYIFWAERFGVTEIMVCKCRVGSQWLPSSQRLMLFVSF